MSGKVITEWDHPIYNRCYCDSLVIISEQVVIPDKVNKRITIYSLTGKVIKHIPCSVIGKKHTAMCSVDNNSIIISDKDISLVSRVNLSSGQVMWSCKDIVSPLGVTCYGGDYVLVASCSTKIISLLDIKTGKVKGELADQVLNDGNWSFSQVCVGNTLAIANYNTLLFFLNDLYLVSKAGISSPQVIGQKVNA